MQKGLNTITFVVIIHQNFKKFSAFDTSPVSKID